MPGKRSRTSLFALASLAIAHEICAFADHGSFGLVIQSHANLALRGGSDSNPKATKVTLDETRLQKMLGTPYTLDMSRDQDRQMVIKFIKQHRLGGGEFNAVVLNGVEYNLPGTNTLVSEKENDHFKDMKGMGQSAKGEKKPLKNTAADILRSKTNYRGLEYSEAELAKLPKAEAEYRRELMARSKEESKMEMGFEGILQGGATVFQDIMQRFRKDDQSAGASNFEDQLPTKGILQFRFKAKESKLTAVSDKAIEKPQWASLRTAAVSRKASQEDDKVKQPSTLESVAAKFSMRYALTLCFQIIWQVLEIALSIVSALKNGILSLFRGQSHQLKEMRQARATIVK